MTSKEALCEILKRTDKKESEYTTKCAEIIVKDLEILQIIKEHLHIYENDAFAFADAFAMYWGAGSSDSEWEKYNEEEYRKKERVKEWWKEWYYPNYKKGE